MHSHPNITTSLTQTASTTTPSAHAEIKAIAPLQAISLFDKKHTSNTLREKAASYLENECKKCGVTTLPADRKKITAFHSTSVPTMPITNYFYRLVVSLPLSDEALIAALFFMNRMRDKVQFDYLTTHRLLLYCWHTADKFFDKIHTDEKFAQVGGIEQTELKKVTNEISQYPLIKADSLKRGEHHAMLAFLLDGEINYKLSKILLDYLIKDLCNLVSSYITTHKTQRPTQGLVIYVNYFHRFPPHFSSEAFTNPPAKCIAETTEEDEDEKSILEAEKRWAGLSP